MQQASWGGGLAGGRGIWRLAGGRGIWRLAGGRGIWRCSRLAGEGGSGG